MPVFKNKQTGDTFEVSEEHAENVIRPQGNYEEVQPEEVSPEPELDPEPETKPEPNPVGRPPKKGK